MNLPLPNAIMGRVDIMTAWRRDFHQHPELMYDLARTAPTVANLLRSFGCDAVIEGIGRTGIVALVHGRHGAATSAEKRVLFRADMDALPIHETTGAPYASTVPGKMHACGHDGHTAMLLGAASYLAETRDFDGTIVFCFQPAEEGGAGAQAMIDDGLLVRWPVKAAYALHNWPEMPVGQFGIIPGAAMAGSDALTLTVTGRGGHAAVPHLARDPIMAAGHLITALQSVVSRVVRPIDPAVLSLTAINGGTAFNVIPETVELKCNIRMFDEAVGDLIRAEIQRICTHIGQSFGVQITVASATAHPYPPTINHAAETALLAAAMRAVAGEAGVNLSLEPVMGSEDFAFILRQVPGCYGFIGNGTSAPLHNPNYDFNDAALPFGVALWAELARRTLG